MLHMTPQDETKQVLIDGAGLAMALTYLFRVPIGRGLAATVRWASAQWADPPEPWVIFLTRLGDWLDPDSGIIGFDGEPEDEE